MVQAQRLWARTTLCATAVAAALTATASEPAPAQGSVTANYGVAAGGNITAQQIMISKGLTQDEVRTLFLDYQKNESASVREVAALAGKLAIKDEAIRSFLRTLHQEQVPDDELFETFAKIAATHLSLLAQRDAIRSASPEVHTLLDKAD